MDNGELSNETPNVRKRKRLTNACDRCRSRKVRCDDRPIACTNCFDAGFECLTRDPRQPRVLVQRRVAQEQVWSPPRSATSGNFPKNDLNRSASQPRRLSVGVTNGSPYVRTPPTTDTTTSTTAATIEHEVSGRQFSGPLPLIPRFISGNSLFVLTQWLDLAFTRLGLPERFSWQYRAHKRGTISHSLGGVNHSLPDIPPWTGENEPALEHFMTTVNLVFPLVNLNDAIQNGSKPSEHCDPTVIQLFRHLVLASGVVAAHNGQNDGKATPVLRSALAHLATLVADESIHSINALILMTLLFRSRDESEMARRIFALAVPKAQSLDLDKTSSIQVNPEASWGRHQQRVDTWSALFILDKVLAIELQRVPMLKNYSMEIESRAGRQDILLKAAIQLARIQGKVCESLLAVSEAQESGAVAASESIRNKVRIGGEMDQLLREWTDQLPPELRPAEYPSCSPDEVPAVAFLALQFYQTLFLIHRNALIVKITPVNGGIDSQFLDDSTRYRMVNSPSLCIKMARMIVSVLNHVSEREVNSLLNSIHAPLTSVYALAIQIVKNPLSETVRENLEIQASAIRIIEGSYSASVDVNPSLSTTINTLHSVVASRANSHWGQSALSALSKPQPAAQVDQTREDASAPSRPTTSRHGIDHITPDSGELEFRTHPVFIPRLDEAGAGVAGNPVAAASYMDTVMEDVYFEMDLTRFDWDAFALTLDLPSLSST